MDRLLTMSEKEMKRLEVMQKLVGRHMKQVEAAEELGVSVRQVKRLVKKYREEGAEGLVSKRRGQPSNNRLAEETRGKALDLLKEKYQGFGPTLAHEKLTEKEGLSISDERLRQLMIEEGLWQGKKAAQAAVHQMRERRACFGELVQVDGSPHDWFEGRAPKCTLLAFIDDATGTLGELRFAPSESFLSYCQAIEAYMKRHGKPMALYTDKHGVFRVNQPTAGDSDALTQFGRAMQQLDIQIICAHSPEAKGRVERVFQTLQDRLPKELRLQGISSQDEGNAFLPSFMDDFNRRFAKQPRSTYDAHRPLTAQDDLAHILTWQETRVLSKNLTIQFNKVVYQIQTQRPAYAMRQAPVTVCVDLNETLSILYKGHPLDYTVFHQQAKQADIVHAKLLDQALEPPRIPHKPAPDHPWRKGFATPLSKSKSPRPLTPPIHDPLPVSG